MAGEIDAKICEMNTREFWIKIFESIYFDGIE